MLLPSDPYLFEVLPRSLYSTAPHAKTANETKPTLLVSWWCTGVALAIILVRLAGRYIRTERLFTEDKIMALSIIPLLARMGLVHVVLRFGTNNALIPDDLDGNGTTRREIGSKCVLASRIMYAAFLWTAKLTISEFLKRLTSKFWKRSYEIGLQAIRYFLVVTFIAVIIATLSECQPFSHYWQVEPPAPPKCRQGAAQLLTMGVSDTVTDILLVCFPIPIILKSQIPLKRKISLVLLFALSLILVAITLYRVVEVIDRHYDQQFRSLLASIEILAAAACSNALVLGSFVRDRGEKKKRFRHHATSQSFHSSQDQRPSTRGRMTQRNWGSDADLAGDLGITCPDDMKEKNTSTTTPAPVALPTAHDAKHLTPLPRHDADAESGLKIFVEGSEDQLATGRRPSKAPSTRNRANFFDFGGLLSDDDVQQRPRQQSLGGASMHNFSRPISPQSTSHLTSRPQHFRTGSDQFLEDVGGLSPKGPRTTQRGSAQSQHGMTLVEALRESVSKDTKRSHPQPPPHTQGSADFSDLGGLLR